jgi:hypothetical protein
MALGAAGIGDQDGVGEESVHGRVSADAGISVGHPAAAPAT